jgi:uncharacterized protein YndB with AHSA1/START domain
MADIRHNVNIKANAEKIYEAITTRDGLAGWWTTDTVAEPKEGSVNIFTFGTNRIEMTIKKLVPDSHVEWECTNAIEEWKGTKVFFDLEQREGKTMLRFNHAEWRAVTDMFAGCNYDWARFLASLKSFCETGSGAPHK